VSIFSKQNFENVSWLFDLFLAIQNFKISPVFNRKDLIMMKNDQNNNFILKTGDILKF
jgi:hypothetical protein